jgi:hypothetical protein
MRLTEEKVVSRILLLTAVFLVSACAKQEPPRAAAARDTLWLIARDPADDAIHASDSEASLRLRYGDSNVVASQVPLGEMETVAGTILFPRDSTRRVTIMWADTLRRTHPTNVEVDGSGTRWVVFPSVSLGTSLAELERLNGRPFHLFGMGFDYSGTVESWEGGRLDSLWTLTGESRRLVGLRLQPNNGGDSAAYARVMGERLFSSSDSAMRVLNPKVYDLFVGPR